MTPLRTTQSRTRPRRTENKVEEEVPELGQNLTNGMLDDDEDDEPPQKRLRTSRNSTTRSRWIPGGRGGGGRRIELEGVATVPLTPITIDNNFPVPAPRTRRRDPSRRRTTTGGRSSTRSRNRVATRPRYSTAAQATAAVAHGDGYKPREERGWEEFHPDLDLDATFAVLQSEEVDGLTKSVQQHDEGVTMMDADDHSTALHTPLKRKPGRPHRTRDSMLQALLTPEQPKFVPRPGPNPRERLTLPKPSYRVLDPFLSYEQKDVALANFVSQAMANVGYQESELYIRPERVFIRQTEGSAEEDLDLSPDLQLTGINLAIGSTGVGRVEYDMDEQDVKWLEALNKTRFDDGMAAIKPAIFEITMTKIEKEWHALEKRIPKPNPKAPQTQRPRSSSAAAVNGEPGNGEEPDSKCAICDDGDCENANAIVFCDGCDLAVHQECYGVPYIPEGQWLCRKCQLVGNARPSCIFCPNEGGAFKQTNNSKWAHLLCASWIPEVTIGNSSLMEPITDVEKVPNSRWKLHCYICKQDMGASIQCSDGRCYEAFHLTCARQAGLYLRMKIGGGQNSLMDPSQLRAYCHRHTPPDWRAEHRTDKAFEHAVKYFKAHFQGQIWADSRASALAITEPSEPTHSGLNNIKMTLTNRKGQKPKTIWRLPSGAPVIPEVILRSIEDSLVRFAVPKKKEYVSDVCKYWTLKREARRGAALLKRLQLQMDTFSSFEVTRRDYKAQGTAGRARLERRIGFAENLAKDLDQIKVICELIKSREEHKLQDAALLKDIVDTTYFPIPGILMPIIDKAMKLDPKEIYKEGLSTIKGRVMERVYNSVTSFSADFAKVFIDDLGFDATKQENLSALYSRPASTNDVEQRERRTLARRIVKAIQPALEEAIKQEAELNGRPFAQQIKEMEDMLFSRRQSIDAVDIPAVYTPTLVEVTDIALGKSMAENAGDLSTDDIPVETATTPPSSTAGQLIHESKSDAISSTLNVTDANGVEPPTPPMSTREQGNNSNQVQINGHAAPVTNGGKVENRDKEESDNDGGIPWYVQQFDPEGTTIWEERWMGQDILREMSEELSEMDESELQDMDISVMEDEYDNAKDTNGTNPVVNGIWLTRSSTLVKGNDAVSSGGGGGSSISAAKKVARRKKGHMWSDRSFRIRR